MSTPESEDQSWGFGRAVDAAYEQVRETYDRARQIVFDVAPRGDRESELDARQQAALRAFDDAEAELRRLRRESAQRLRAAVPEDCR